MTLAIQYSCPKELAYSVSTIAREHHFRKASPRPWYHANPGDCMWWVVPERKHPAYDSGKFFLSRFDEDDQLKEFDLSGNSSSDASPIFCGIQLEKGFGEVLKDVVSSHGQRDRVMNARWIWKTFVAQLSGKVADVAEACQEALGEPLMVRVTAFEFQSGGDYKGAKDQVDFAALKRNLVCRSTIRVTEALSGISQCTSFEELESEIAAIPKSDWISICVFVGIVAMPETAESDNVTLLDGQELWRLLLARWTPWFTSG